MKTLLAHLCFLLSLTLQAQQVYLSDVMATQELSKKIVALFAQDSITAAFAELQPYWPLPAEELTSLEAQTFDLLEMVSERFGTVIGSGKVRTETVADFAIRETWLIRRQRSAIRVMFTYYKNDRGWIVNAFNWDDAMSEEFRD